MGRPRKHEHEKRTASTRTDLTEAEKIFLQQQVANSGTRSEAEYVRKRILSERIVVPAAKAADPALISLVNQTNLELRAWGNNLNQIARNKNSGRRERIGWEEAQQSLQELIKKSEAVLEKLVDTDDS